MSDPRIVEALRREGEAYKTAGMIDRLLLVNEQLRGCGVDEIDVPKQSAAARQTRQSAQAAQRRTRSKKS